MGSFACPSCGASGSDTSEPPFASRGQNAGTPIVACLECDTWFAISGVLRRRVRALSDDEQHKFRGVWFGEGPGRARLLSDIAAGRSNGENAYTLSGEIIEEGRPFSRARMRDRPPLYTPFRYVCGRGHPIDGAVIFTLGTNTGIQYGWACEPDEIGARCDVRNVWAYPTWDPADEAVHAPPGTERECRRQSLLTTSR